MPSNYGIEIFDIVYSEYYKHIKYEIKNKNTNTNLLEFVKHQKKIYGDRKTSLIYLKKPLEFYYDLIFNEYIDVISKIYEYLKDNIGKFKSKQHILRCIISIVVHDIINKITNKIDKKNKIDNIITIKL